jgi:hypothetical protein
MNPEQPSWDDLVGAQQDNNARLRYDMVREVEGNPDFQGCRTVLDVHTRELELSGEERMRMSLVSVARTQYPNLPNPEGWAAQVIQCVKEKNEQGLMSLYQRGVLSRFMSPPGPLDQ